jgi:hypothetical protein
MLKMLFPFCLLLLILPLVSFCQEDFRPGYIITNNSDTIHGLINLKSNLQNSMYCEFRNTDNSAVTRYSPKEISGYRIDNNKFYITREVSLADEKEIVFLEYLIDGIVDLFYLKTKTGDNYYIEKNGIMHQLSNDEKQVVINNVIYEKNSNEYIGVLNTLFRDSPETLTEIKNTPFSYKELVKLTKDYHYSVCKNQVCIDYSKSTKTVIWIEPNAGTAFSWMGYKTSVDYAFNNRIFGGINIRFIPFRSHYVWNFGTGLVLSSSDFSGDFKNSLYDGTFHIQTKYTTVRIPLTVEYSFPQKKLQPFMSLSYENILLLNSSYEILDKNYHPVKSALRKYQFGIAFDVGLRYYLKKSSYIFLKNEFEFRKSLQNYKHALDYHRIFSEMLNVGIGFKIN